MSNTISRRWWRVQHRRKKERREDCLEGGLLCTRAVVLGDGISSSISSWSDSHWSSSSSIPAEGQQVYWSGIATSWSCHKPSNGWTIRNETSELAFRGYTYIWTRVKLQPSTMIWIQFSTLCSTVISQLLQIDTEFIQSANSILYIQLCPVSMLCTFCTCECEESQVMWKKISKNKRGLCGQLRESMGV